MGQHHGLGREGLIRRGAWSRIRDITVDKPIVGRLLGYGHLTFESAAQDQGLRKIKYVARPDQRDLKIQRVVQVVGLRGPRVLR